MKAFCRFLSLASELNCVADELFINDVFKILWSMFETAKGDTQVAGAIFESLSSFDVTQHKIAHLPEQVCKQRTHFNRL